MTRPVSPHSPSWKEKTFWVYFVGLWSSLQEMQYEYFFCFWLNVNADLTYVASSFSNKERMQSVVETGSLLRWDNDGADEFLVSWVSSWKFPLSSSSIKVPTFSNTALLWIQQVQYGLLLPVNSLLFRLKGDEPPFKQTHVKPLNHWMTSLLGGSASQTQGLSSVFLYRMFCLRISWDRFELAVFYEIME